MPSVCAGDDCDATNCTANYAERTEARVKPPSPVAGPRARSEHDDSPASLTTRKTRDAGLRLDASRSSPAAGIAPGVQTEHEHSGTLRGGTLTQTLVNLAHETVLIIAGVVHDLANHGDGGRLHSGAIGLRILQGRHGNPLVLGEPVFDGR